MGTVRALVDFVRAWERRTIMYAGIVRARTDAIYGLGNIRMISHAGPYGDRRIP